MASAYFAHPASTSATESSPAPARRDVLEGRDAGAAAGRAGGPAAPVRAYARDRLGGRREERGLERGVGIRTGLRRTAALLRPVRLARAVSGVLVAPPRAPALARRRAALRSSGMAAGRSGLLRAGGPGRVAGAAGGTTTVAAAAGSRRPEGSRGRGACARALGLGVGSREPEFSSPAVAAWGPPARRGARARAAGVGGGPPCVLLRRRAGDVGRWRRCRAIPRRGPGFAAVRRLRRRCRRPAPGARARPERFARVALAVARRWPAWPLAAVFAAAAKRARPCACRRRLRAERRAPRRAARTQASRDAIDDGSYVELTRAVNATSFPLASLPPGIRPLCRRPRPQVQRAERVLYAGFAAHPRTRVAGSCNRAAPIATDGLACSGAWPHRRDPARRAPALRALQGHRTGDLQPRRHPRAGHVPVVRRRRRAAPGHNAQAARGAADSANRLHQALRGAAVQPSVQKSGPSLVIGGARADERHMQQPATRCRGHTAREGGRRIFRHSPARMRLAEGMHVFIKRILEGSSHAAEPAQSRR